MVSTYMTSNGLLARVLLRAGGLLTRCIVAQAQDGHENLSAMGLYSLRHSP